MNSRHHHHLGMVRRVRCFCIPLFRFIVYYRQVGSLGKDYPGYYPLRLTKYRGVHSITFFFADNVSGGPKTQINRLILYGQTRDALDMSKFNKDSKCASCAGGQCPKK